MRPEATERRLAAILSADVAGDCWVALRRFRMAS
jgi:hypothetical protein